MEEITIKKIIFHETRAYKLLREFPHYFFMGKDGGIIAEKFNAWRGWLGADHVLKTRTHFLFCETIQDIEYKKVKSESKDE